MGLNMESAVADIGGGLGLGGNDNGLDDTPPTDGGIDGTSDLGGDAGGAPGDGGAGATGDLPKPEAGEADLTAGGDSPDPAGPVAFVPPKTWTPAAAAKLASADPEVQKEVLKREEDMFRGLEMYKQDANLGKGFASMVQPYMPLLTHFKVDVGTLIPNLLEAHKTLSIGTPAEKVAYFRKLASDYQLDMAEVAAEIPYEDPEARRLRVENQRLQSENQRTRSEQEAHARQTAASVLDKFIADPKNIYFDAVGADVAKLLQSGVCSTLEEAYEKAVWTNPVTRAKEQARLTTEKAAKDRADAVARTEAARKASAANVRTSAKSAGGTAALGSIDDTITGTLKNIRARA